MKAAGAVLSAILVAAVTAWINAKMAGTPLNGMPGIIRFWKKVFQGSVPVWFVLIVVVFLAAACLLWFAASRKKTGEKVKPGIVVLSTPPPRWSIGAMGEVPVMNISLHMRMAHMAEYSLEIVKAYLEGTDCVAPFFPQVVTGPYDPSVMIHFGVRPILAKDGEAFARKIVLLDQFGNKHRTERIRFQPSPKTSPGFAPGGTPLRCMFCQGTIAMEELADFASVPAHKQCIR